MQVNKSTSNAAGPSTPRAPAPTEEKQLELNNELTLLADVDQAHRAEEEAAAVLHSLRTEVHHV